MSIKPTSFNFLQQHAVSMDEMKNYSNIQDTSLESKLPSQHADVTVEIPDNMELPNDMQLSPMLYKIDNTLELSREQSVNQVSTQVSAPVGKQFSDMERMLNLMVTSSYQAMLNSQTRMNNLEMVLESGLKKIESKFTDIYNDVRIVDAKVDGLEHDVKTNSV